MAHWIRYKLDNEVHFGTLVDNEIIQHEGDMYSNPRKTQTTYTLDSVEVLTPCQPSKMLAIWNNFHATAKKNNMDIPLHPWYFVKTNNTFAPAFSVIKRPGPCEGKILFEGELGIVIGKTCNQVPVESVADYVFGYTCVNDVTAIEYLFKEKSFEHWTRAKCFDGFGVIGPVIATDINPDVLNVKTYLVGDEVQTRQDYSVNDMIFTPAQIVSSLSHDMTLNPGDVIACGTSLGAGAMKDGWTVEIEIEGIGKLSNVYQD